MATVKTPLLLSLLGALLCSAPVGAAPVVKPIEAFVSPGQLFPVEGTSFLQPNGTEPEQYRPLPAYDKPNGVVIGEVRLVNRHCVTEQPPADCQNGLAWALHLASGKTVALETAEYSYETEALLSYGKSIGAPNGTAWSSVASAGGMFWVHTQKSEVHRFEELVTFVEKFEQWCTAPGKCAEPTAEMKRELERLRTGKLTIVGCTSGYDVTGIVKHQGKRYYRIARPELDSSSPRTTLPKTGFVPVRNRVGGHTGTFSSRGC